MDESVLEFEWQYPHRKYVQSDIIDVWTGYGHCKEERRRWAKFQDANLISSKCCNGQHAPAIDIDFPARLVPSSTEGHYHLYFDIQMPWWKYKRLLRALKNAGIVEKGFYKIAKRRKQTHLRLPHVRKP